MYLGLGDLRTWRRGETFVFLGMALAFGHRDQYSGCPVSAVDQRQPKVVVSADRFYSCGRGGIGFGQNMVNRMMSRCYSSL